MESERILAQRPQKFADIYALAGTREGRENLQNRICTLASGVRMDPNPPEGDLSAQLSSLSGGTQGWEYAVIQDALNT